MPHDQTLQPPSQAVPLAPRARRPAFALPALRQIWFQTHWFIGITAGTVLLVIGLSGSTLAFRDEILDAINPGVRSVPVRDARSLSPEELAAAVTQAHGEGRIANVTLFSKPGMAARINFAPAPGERRGETVYVDPYSGALRPELRGGDFFEWVESLHRWLLLPRDTGRVVAGTLATCLLVMALSGLYLRWPRRPLSWRSWLTFDPKLKGRPFLWGLHSVLGTWALVMYLVSTSTGLYWAFDIVKGTVDGWVGASGRPERVAATPARASRNREGGNRDGSNQREGKDSEKDANTRIDLATTWKTFEETAGPWQQASLRVPERGAQPVLITWLAADAPHERARNRMSVQARSGEVVQDERYAMQSHSDQFVTLIYPLHTGTYWGLPGRIAMLIGALFLPVFVVTGWMMYLGRRKLKAAAAFERHRLTTVQPAAAAYVDQQDPVLVAFASQTGQAERLALQSAGVLQRAGLATLVQSLDRLSPDDLRRHTRVLLVAASFGEGDPPDGVRRFMRLLQQPTTARLTNVQYGLLALGDRGYANFCGFGHALDRRLQSLGAKPLFPLIEVDHGDPAAINEWSRTVGELAGVSLDEHEQTEAFDSARPAEPYERWTLARRTLLNPGSVGAPLYEVALTRDGATGWQAGMLVELLPRQAPRTVAACLAELALDGATPVVQDGVTRTLADALARSELPGGGNDGSSAQQVVDRLQPLVPRRYSIASLRDDRELQLLVRQEQHAWGLGLASGWLTAHAPLAAEVELRVLTNQGFEPTTGDAPCIFIGNGSGLAGLRAHIRARIKANQRQNWLVFGERQRAHDSLCADEIRRWSDTGFLARLDLAFSRDGEDRRYVQDHLRDAAIEVRAWVADGAVIYVCGSLLGMASGVDAALTEILGREQLEDLIAADRYRRDIY